jgi:hypothetical protein
MLTSVPTGCAATCGVQVLRQGQPFAASGSQKTTMPE